MQVYVMQYIEKAILTDMLACGKYCCDLQKNRCLNRGYILFVMIIK